MRIAAVGRALPEHYYEQGTLLRFLQGVWRDDPAVARRLESLHDSVQVKGRYLALPLERYAELRTFGATNDAWIEEIEGGGRRRVYRITSVGRRVLDDELRRLDEIVSFARGAALMPEPRTTT